jgi:hypothetical protein
MTQQLAITIKRFLRPDWRKILLLTLFGLIAAGGQIQAWAFSDDPQTKPPLYDLLRPLPLWFIWVVSMLPLIVLSTFLRSMGFNPSKIGVDANLLWGIALVTYYYLLSCLVVGLFDLGKDRFTR